MTRPVRKILLPTILLFIAVASVQAQSSPTLSWSEDPASIVTGYIVTIDGVSTDHGLSPLAPNGTCGCAVVLPFSGGRHVITVSAYNSSGQTASAPLTIGPAANAGGPYTGQSGAPIAVTASGSNAPTGSLVSYVWQWGDGSSNTTVSSPQASHTYAANGTFTITLTVTDNAGATSQATTTAAVTTVSAAAAPTFSPAAGTYSSAQSVTISDTTSGATIYYTTNGMLPTTSSTKYTGAVTVSSTETIQAVAVASGHSQSAVASASYTINAGTPTFTATASANPTSIASSGSSTISFSVKDTGAALSNANVEVQVFNSSGTAVGTGVFSGQNFAANGTLSFTYVWSPAAQNPAVTAAGNYTVMIGVFNSSWATNYYWNSNAATIALTVPAAATPTFSPAAGTYTSAQSVTISDTTSGATIYYTINGVTPTTSSTKYTGAVSVSSTGAILAIAVASGYSQSAVASASYTINVGTPTFTATVTANPTSIASSGSSTISFSVKDTGAALSNANVEVQVFNSSGTAVGTGVFSGQNFTANGTLPFTYIWTPSIQNPAVTATGNYTVMIGVFNSAWGTVYYWNNNAATITLH